jgi:hypothetical protein
MRDRAQARVQHGWHSLARGRRGQPLDSSAPRAAWGVATWPAWSSETESCSCKALGRRRVLAPPYPGRKPRLWGPAHAEHLVGAGCRPPHTIWVASWLRPALGRGTTRDGTILGKVGGSCLLTDQPHRAALDTTTWPTWSSATNSEPCLMLDPLGAPDLVLSGLRAGAGQRVFEV